MRCRLPWGVRELVRQLADQRVDAAKRVLDAAGVALKTDVRNRSVTSLDTALLDGLINRAKQARSVHIVSPFFDGREHAGPSIELTVLRVLAKQYPKAQFRIFLPEITRADGKLALQGSKAFFALVFGPKAGGDRLGFCGVPSDQRPLHAKLLAIRHGKGGTRATVLTGSPNLTENALRRMGTSANVELAREVAVRWKDVEQLLLPFRRKVKKLSECLFEPPQSIAAIGWHVLKSATYRPLRRELELEWRQPDAVRQTQLYYAEALLNVPARGPLQGFGIRNGELRLEAVCRADPSRRSWWPIVIPFGEQLALAELPEQGNPPPEWWLAQLGALPITRSAGDRTQYRGSGPASAIPATFSLGQRVRDLAERMGYVREVLANDDSAEPQQVDAHLDLLEKIFEVHDPETATDPT